MKQAIVWSKNKNNLDKNDEIYVVNQTLMFGNLKDIKKLVRNKGLEKIKTIFISQPSKIYTPQAFNFIKNYILKINQSLDQSKYVKTLY